MSLNSVHYLRRSLTIFPSPQLTGDKEPAGVLTGRVKADGDPVVETTKQRSERDGQGRELDSYGKPYDL